jgi:hypothetical protein
MIIETTGGVIKIFSDINSAYYRVYCGAIVSNAYPSLYDKDSNSYSGVDFKINNDTYSHDFNTGTIQLDGTNYTTAADFIGAFAVQLASYTYYNPPAP